ncbi:MAG: ABC transporter permease [Coriobacteriales bacterium]|jgi:ABC-2 type transport system permease protein|nr:ABC transporter permease [Coriobacteriales bacterium]
MREATSQDRAQNNWRHDSFVLRSLVSKDFKLRYRRSILGVAWSVLNPLLMMVVLTAVFSYMFRFNIAHYPLYFILGQIMFNFINAGTSGGMTSILDSSALIKKIRINKSVFPVEKVIFELVNFAISLIAVALVFIYFLVFPTPGEPPLILTWNIVWLPLLLVYATLFGVGLSFLLSALAVFFRDVIHLWGIFTLAWTYATPLFYPIEQLAPWMQQLMMFNPMYHYVTYFRDIVMWGVTPSLKLNFGCLAFALITLGVGYLVFRLKQRKFILYV